MAKDKQAKKPGKFRAAIINWMGGSVPSVGCETPAVGHDMAGMAVTPHTAMQLDAVWACVRLISETIATMPLSMYQRANNGQRIARSHRLHSILHYQPNRETTAAVFWESVVAAMLLRGNAFAEKLFVSGRLVGLRFLAPDRLSCSQNRDGSICWTYLEADGRRREVPSDLIWQIPGFSLDGVNGVSVIQYGANVFGAAMAGDRAARETFNNGMLQNVYYKHDKFLNQEQRQGFHENVRGSVERGESPLLEGGIDVKALGINPNDAQLLESRGFDVESICRWFRVPPHMVGHTEKTTSWGSGVEQQMIGFMTFTLAPWLRRIEQAISKDLLSPGDRLTYYPKFNAEGLLRADSQGRAQFYKVMVENGIYTRDEVREKEDMEPRGGKADSLTVQSNMADLESLGEQNQ